MSKRSVLVGAVGAAALFVAAQGGASANVVWCFSDPPIQVTTPAGHNLTVNNTVYMARPYVRFNRFIKDSAVAVSDGHGGTLIIVNVYVPETISRAVIISSENRYQLSTTASAEGGEGVTTFLDVPTP